MNKHLKIGLIFAIVCLVLVSFSLFANWVATKSPRFPTTIEASIVILGLPGYFLNLPAQFSTIMILPQQYCAQDITHCTTSFSRVFELIFSVILYFLLGIMFSILFRRNKKV